MSVGNGPLPQSAFPELQVVTLDLAPCQILKASPTPVFLHQTAFTGLCAGLYVYLEPSLLSLACFHDAFGYSRSLWTRARPWNNPA